MSYARFGDESDVYVYYSGDNVYCCCACKLEDNWYHGGRSIIDHLEEHVAAGHRVPAYCLEALREDVR